MVFLVPVDRLHLRLQELGVEPANVSLERLQTISALHQDPSAVHSNWRCWQDRKPYDEAKYLLALKKKGSPLVAQLAL